MSLFTQVFAKNPENETKFSDLKKYFTKVTKEDVLAQDIYDYISWASPEDKSLMDVFIRDQLSPYLLKCVEVQVPDTQSLETPIYDNNSLLGARRIGPSSFSGKMTINQLVDMECPLKVVSLIDLSENHLGSADLEHVLKLVENLNNQGKLSASTIMLADNRIHGIQGMEFKVRAWLNKLVEINEVKHVVLRDNPFCSIDQKRFLSRIGLTNEGNEMPSPEIESKLIWIARWHLFSDGWKTCMDISDEIAERIKMVHLKFYEPKSASIFLSPDKAF